MRIGPTAAIGIALVWLSAAVACGEDGTGPGEPGEHGSLVVRTSTTGPVDWDGYQVQGIGATRPIQSNDSILVSGLATGPRTISLGDVTSTCGPLSPESVAVTIEGDRIATVSFDLACHVEIVYIGGDTTPDVGVWNADAEGRGANLLFRKGVHSLWATRISPDGTRLAYASGPSQLDPANLEIRDLFTGETDVVLEESHVYDLTWLPDGQHIAYIRELVGIYVVDLTTGHTEQISDHKYARNLDASAGSRLAFRDRDTLLVMDADGSGVTSFPYERRPEGNDAIPRWSPDGARLAFSMRDSTDYVIRIANPDGPEREEPYREGAGISRLQDWSPDGEWLLYENLGRLYRVRADGTDTTRIRVGAFGHWGVDASWNPGSSWPASPAQEAAGVATPGSSRPR